MIDVAAEIVLFPITLIVYAMFAVSCAIAVGYGIALAYMMLGALWELVTWITIRSNG